MVLAACPRAPHQPGALEHLHVLRDGVERHVEGLGEVGYARGALRQPLDDLSARRVRERREGEVENRGRHIFNLWVEYSNWPALVKRSEVTPERPLAVRAPYRSSPRPRVCSSGRSRSLVIGAPRCGTSRASSRRSRTRSWPPVTAREPARSSLRRVSSSIGDEAGGLVPSTSRWRGFASWLRRPPPTGPR